MTNIARMAKAGDAAMKVVGKACAVWMVAAFLAYLSPMLGVEKGFSLSVFLMAMISLSVLSLFILVGLFARSVFLPLAESRMASGIALNWKIVLLATILLMVAVFGGDAVFGGEWRSFFESLLGAGRSVAAAAVSGALLWSCWLVGKRLLAAIFKKNERISNEPAFALPFGILIFSFVFLALGAAGLYYSWLAWAITVLIMWLGRRESMKAAKVLWQKRTAARIVFSKAISFNGLAWLILGTIFLGFFVSMSANLLSGGSDTFHQYLTFPSQYAESHGIVEFRYHPHFGFPQLAEMVYSWGILLGGTQIPFSAAYLVLAACLWLLKKIIRERKKGSDAFVWAALMIITVPFLFGFGMGYLKVEPFLMLYVLAAFLAVSRYLSEKKASYLILSFCFLAASLDVKYTGAFVIGSAFVSFAAMRSRFRFSWKMAAIFVGVSGALFLPWALKDLYYYGNPLYPILDGNDHISRSIGIHCQPDFVRNSKEDMYVNYKGSYRMLSGSYVLANARFLSRKVFIGWSENAMDLGPWMGMFLPLAIFWAFFSKDGFVRFLGVFSAIYVFGWTVFMAGQPWYLIPALLAFIVIIADMLGSGMFPSKGMAKILIMVWAVWEMQIFFLIGSFPEKIAFIRRDIGFPEALARINEKNPRDQRADHWRIESYIDEKIVKNDPTAVVYGFGDMRDGYFVKDSYRRFVPDLFGFTFNCLASGAGDYANMKSLGIRYFIVDSRYSPTCASEDNQERFSICKAERDFERFLMINGDVLFRSGDLSLLELK